MLPLLPCFKILPLVYDESLSYYEVLCNLSQMLQEMSKNVDGNFDTIQKEIEKIYKEITDLKNYVDEKDKEISDRIDLTNEKIEEEIKKCHEHCEKYAQGLYNDLVDLMNKYRDELMQWTLGEISKIPSGISKQFAIVGDKEKSGLQYDVKDIIRENACNFVDCHRWDAYYMDSVVLPIIHEGGVEQEQFTCYDYDSVQWTKLLKTITNQEILTSIVKQSTGNEPLSYMFILDSNILNSELSEISITIPLTDTITPDLLNIEFNKIILNFESYINNGYVRATSSWITLYKDDKLQRRLSFYLQKNTYYAISSSGIRCLSCFNDNDYLNRFNDFALSEKDELDILFNDYLLNYAIPKDIIFKQTFSDGTTSDEDGKFSFKFF